MDDKTRSSGTETNETEDSPQKQSRRRRTPSVDPSERSDVKSKRRSRSRSKSSRSRSPSRDRSGRRRQSHSRGHFSPDKRYGRFNRGGFQRDFHNNRRRRSPSRSPGFRGGRNRNARRSRSSSYDRHRNRRNTSTSRDRSQSQGRAPPTSNYQQQQDYAPSHFQPEYQVAQPPYTSQSQFANYDYVPMLQVPPTSFPAYPPPPTQEYMWNAQIPPPPIISCVPNATQPAEAVNSENEQEHQKRQAAIAAEKKIQRDTIRKQRDDYIKRSSALKRELITLKEQREELASGTAPPSPTTNGFIKENDRLQTQIENKIGTIENVIEMLNGILNTDKSDTESPRKAPKPAPKEPSGSDDSSPERLKTKVIESLSRKRKDSDRNRKDENLPKSVAPTPTEQMNYKFFDPEQHWCKGCSAFPKTAKEYLLHLHSEEHKNNAKPPEIPWHENLVNDDMPSYLNAPTKRTPIRGLQFFVPSTAWYCKLCSLWIGDLHCASAHLKSQTHAQEYDKHLTKNPRFENEWLAERQKAFDLHRETGNDPSQKVLAPPSPPVISFRTENKLHVPPPPSIAPPPPFVDATNRVFDGIPLQINQRAKEVKDVPVNEEVEKKKGKKKKKEKKKRKKSKKKHRHSSSSSSSSSDDSSASASPEAKSSAEKVIDSSASIRVAMRNAVNTVPQRAHLKPKSDDDEVPTDAGGWTIVQAEQKAIPPKPPIISANGEAQNRRDDVMISQWTPVPVISEKEKQLFEQLKGKLKKKKENTPPATTVQNPVQLQSNAAATAADETKDRSSRANDKRHDESDKEFKDVKEKDRRDAYRKRRSRSPSTPRRDRRSRSPRRDRRRRSRSPTPPRRDRRYSRSPRRDRRRDRFSRSRSKERRTDRNDPKAVKNIKNPDKALAAAKKAAAANAGKKLPFIGRMPVFKKQSTEDESKKQEPVNDLSEEERIIKKKKQDELKFQIHQKQQMLQLHQKHAEAYNLAHPGQFANIYSTHGTIHHILPNVQPEEYDLMPDPRQYAHLMTAPPPPMPEPEVPRYKETNEPVLPPGIDVEEAENMELEAAAPPPPPPTDRDILPKDFQDALSIIFDRGAETGDNAAAAAVKAPAESDNSNEMPNVVMQDDSVYAQMDLASMDSQHSQHIEHDQNGTIVGANTMEIDDQAAYMLYEEHFVQSHIQQPQTVPPVHAQSIDLAPQNIPTPPIQILDAAGNLTQIPGPVLEVGSDFVMLDPDGNRIDHNPNVIRADAGNARNEHDIELENKRRQELDDLAMLGIDADDLAAQCI